MMTFRRHLAGEKCKMRLLTKAQHVIMIFGVRDNAEL